MYVFSVSVTKFSSSAASDKESALTDGGKSPATCSTCSMVGSSEAER